MFKYLVAIGCLAASSTLAEGVNKFMAQGGEVLATDTAVTCTVPEGSYPHIYGVKDLDTYLASKGPGFASGYVANPALWFGNGEPLNIVQGFAVTTDEKAAQTCAALEAGTATVDQVAYLEYAVRRDQLWWKVDSQDFEGNDVSGYVTARYVGFTSYDTWIDEFGPKLGFTSTNHSAPNRIVEITNTDTAFARMSGDVIPYDVVGYCHLGFNTSDLYRDAEEGRINEPVDRGIWTGCNEETETLLSFEEYADCEARTIWGQPVTAQDIHYPTGAGAGYGDFVRLCPKTSKEMIREACEAGDTFVCDAMDDGPISSVCDPQEQTEFSCRIDGRSTSVSLCARDGYLSYVYGEDSDWPELRIRKPERSSYFDVYDPETTTFANGDYYYRVNASNDPASVEVFKGQIDPEHLITTQYCVPR
ncbi:hypothetical protein SAMN05444279_13522 [Ruegeria intermedia]|uniref:Uncharacterized protein n=1 Tax=Ruegeria intermedia TaxID=996115 RepID=A0A1M5BB08_9RHOB|nr:hypothetical protein [Ruegeria intermedia]SHF39362.1 hypothetical protein SAMN05444279_13522 [Ruegeria intermedia]